MAGVSWIKINADLFTNRKIMRIRREPNGDSLFAVWILLITLAGQCNDSGRIWIADNVPYTESDLAMDYNFAYDDISRALALFEQLGMIEIVNGFITVSDWENHQNIEGMERIREQTRIRQRRHREKQAQIKAYGETCAYCGNVADSIDHVIPKTKGGSGEPDNLVPCCMSCNTSKNNVDLVDFLNRKLALREHLEIDSIMDNPKLNRYVVYDDTNKKFVTRDICGNLRDGNAIDKNRIEKNRIEKNNNIIRHKYGEYKHVLLSDSDLEKLKTEFPDWQERIERLDSYIESKGASYKNHLATIRNWARKDKEQNAKIGGYSSGISETGIQYGNNY